MIYFPRPRILAKFAFSVHCLFLICACCCVIRPLEAQIFSIKRVELVDQMVVIHYDLLDSIAGRDYNIKIFSSTDNFINALQHVSGEIGLTIKPGMGKKVVWDAKRELGENYTGSVSLEIRGVLYVPFVHFSGFEEYKVLKRGKTYQLTWSGGSPRNILNFDLYRGDTKVTTFANIANGGYSKITLPIDIRPGKNYYLRISDAKNQDEVVYTGKFAVKRKIPLFVKLIPIAAAAALIPMLSGGDDAPYAFAGLRSDSC
jgi:hypothetical protein